MYVRQRLVDSVAVWLLPFLMQKRNAGFIQTPVAVSTNLTYTTTPFSLFRRLVLQSTKPNPSSTTTNKTQVLRPRDRQALLPKVRALPPVSVKLHAYAPLGSERKGQTLSRHRLLHCCSVSPPLRSPTPPTQFFNPISTHAYTHNIGPFVPSPSLRAAS